MPSRSSREKEPVSYTHLDVYKRQELTLNNSKLTLDSYRNGSPQIYYIAFA